MTQFCLKILRMCQNEPADFCVRDSALENFGKSLKIALILLYIVVLFFEKNCLRIISSNLTKKSRKMHSWHGICYKKLRVKILI